jgi:uncharacterized protein
MRLYSGLSPQFIDEATRGTIAGRLEKAFLRYFRYKPSQNEVQSWDRSLRALTRVFSASDLTDHGVVLEYQLPLTSRRLDCLVCGKSSGQADNSVIIELKQWQGCEPAEGEHLVATWVGGAVRETLHPSAQVGQYQLYLEDTHTAFWEGDSPVSLSSCAFLHNYEPLVDDALLAPKFTDLLQQHPSFLARDFDRLGDYLRQRLDGGAGEAVLRRIEDGKYRPSKKLMEHVGRVIKGRREYVLLDEQLVVYETVLSAALRGAENRKEAILVRGGPGTGKSVIAINLVSDLLLANFNAHYATGSKAFTETLRSVIGSRSSAQFKYFNSYVTADPESIDVLICDEAHRIRETSNNRFTKTALRSKRHQIEELLDAARVAVFFIDDRQVVRPNEVGSSELIRQEAAAKGFTVREYELEAQFRCAGSDGFVNRVNNTLGIERTANVLWDPAEDFDFRMLPSPEALEEAIRWRATQGHSARLTAGFCWKWSKPQPDGQLVPDVVVGEFQRPWNARSDAGRLAPGIPKEALWANDPKGIEQIGCIYTAQGFEFDYVGVIFGEDLVYDWDTQAWVGQAQRSYDTVVRRSGQQFVDLVKNTYRVLLSRGLKGCYVHFLDKGTERFVRSRVEGDLRGIEAIREEQSAKQPALPFQILPFARVRPFVNAVPLYRIDAAAGGFGPERRVEQAGAAVSPADLEWVELPQGLTPQNDLFVTQVLGDSMNRRIPNGSWCLFRYVGPGTRNGRVVLAEHRELADVDTGGRYTVKLYESRKRVGEDGTWQHTEILLRPDSNDSRYRDICVTEEDAQALKIVAELVAVLT